MCAATLLFLHGAHIHTWHMKEGATFFPTSRTTRNQGKSSGATNLVNNLLTPTRQGAARGIYRHVHLTHPPLQAFVLSHHLLEHQRLAPTTLQNQLIDISRRTQSLPHVLYTHVCVHIQHHWCKINTVRPFFSFEFKHSFHPPQILTKEHPSVPPPSRTVQRRVQFISCPPLPRDLSFSRQQRAILVHNSTPHTCSITF